MIKYCTGIIIFLLFSSCIKNPSVNNKKEYYPNGNIKQIVNFNKNSETESIIEYSKNGDTVFHQKNMVPHIGTAEFNGDSTIYKFYLKKNSYYVEEWLVVNNQNFIKEESDYLLLKEKKDSVGFQHIGPDFRDLSLIFSRTTNNEKDKSDTIKIKKEVGVKYFPKTYFHDKKIKGVFKTEFLAKDGGKRISVREVNINWERKKAFQEFFGIS